MTKEAKIAKEVLGKVQGMPTEQANELMKEALTKIGEYRRSSRPVKSSWDVAPRNRECTYGYVNTGWI